MPKLDRIYIEISNICNLQCSFCPEVLRPKKVLALNDFEHILSQAAPLANQICLHLMGEPLLHPEFEEILAVSQKYSAPINLTSNGLLLEKRLPLILAAKNVRQLNISLQSFKDNFPQKDLNQYLQNIFEQIKIISEKRSDMYINLRLWNHGVENENEDIFQSFENFFGVPVSRKFDVASIKSKKVLEKIYFHFDSRFDWPSLSLPHQGQAGTCHALETHIGIHAEGTVVPCCLDKEAQINLGNIFEQSLESILNSERAQKMIHG
ncbi:MAG: SPASM domain-containing protein, partial [Bacteriovoracaceae bacterium]|nr:SPASM domain-containing protein [Bacteriovoracaceae bacterium]